MLLTATVRASIIISIADLTSDSNVFSLTLIHAEFQQRRPRVLSHGACPQPTTQAENQF